jgi:hypothetical protein
MISGCFPSSALMSCHPCTVVVPAMRHRTGCALSWWWCHPALWRRHRPVIYLSGHAGVAWSWFCTVTVAHVGHVSALSPRRKARGFPALVRFARARPAGQAVEACVIGIAVEPHVVGLAVEAHVARGQLLFRSPHIPNARPAIICHVTRDQSLYHMSGYAWQRNSPCQLTWADGPGYFQAKK